MLDMTCFLSVESKTNQFLCSAEIPVSFCSREQTCRISLFVRCFTYKITFIIIIIKMQDLEWHIIMSVIAGALYIVKSRVGYKRSFEHDSLELSTEDVEGRCSTK